MGIRPLMLDVTEGTTNNTTVPTLGKVEDLIGVENLWDRVTGTPNYLLPNTAADDIGATGARITKIWATDIESTNYPSVNGTALSNQYLATTDTPTFAQLTVDNIRINGNTILVTNADGSLTIDCNGAGTVDMPRAGTFGAVTAATQIYVGNIDIAGDVITSSANVDLKSSLATGLVRILDDSGTPVFSYDNDTDIFRFSDTVCICVGNELQVNTINTFNAVAGVTIEDVELLNGAIKANSIAGLTDAILSITAYAGKGITLTGGDNDDILITAGLNGYVKMDNVRIYSSTVETTAGDLKLISASNGVTIGDGGDIDYYLTFNGASNQGIIKFWEDENFFDFNTLVGVGSLLSNGNISAAGYVTQTGIFAEIYVADASTAQSIATGAGYTKSTAFTSNGQSSNCTADATNDKITITKTGRYRVSGSCSATAGKANLTWRGAAFLNGAEQNQVHWKRKMTTTTDSGDMSFIGFIDVTSAPWDLDFRLRHDDGGNQNFTIEYANLNVEYMGKT